MYSRQSGIGYTSPIDGIEQKTLVYGEKTLMTEFRLKKDATLPMHSHPHEQIGYLVSGKIRLHIDGQRFECLPGDSWCVPGDVEHGADVLEDAVAIEVFSPVREDYLP
jgi:quercetin dioxygenase-like cupin family protein